MKRIRLHNVLLSCAGLIVLWAGAASAGAVKGLPGTQYALVVGIDRFEDPVIKPLRYCVEDAQAFHELLVDPKYGRYPEENAVLLLNDEATTQNIKDRIEELARCATKDDTVTVFFSSHGFQDKKGTTFWTTYNTKVDRAGIAEGKVALAKGTSLDNDTIASLLNAIEAHRLIVFLDCCFSADTVLRATRGVASIVGPDVKKVKDPFAELKGKGRVIVSSSDGNQRSAELPDLKHGAFTYYLLEGLKGQADDNRDNVVEVLELWDYLEKRVEEAARRIGIVQKPTMTLTKFTHHFPLTTYPLLLAAQPAEPPPELEPTTKPEPKPEDEAAAKPEQKPEAPLVAKPKPEPKQEAQPAPSPKPQSAADAVQVELPGGKALWLSVHEITNAEFAEFVKANPQWSKANIDTRYHDGDYLKHWNSDTHPEGKADYPVVYVSWYAAKAYADWRGARLPTEAEWETVAAGPRHTQFPWGDDWDPARCNSAESTDATLQPATALEFGAARWTNGTILNLAGNAWEWCDDFYYQYDENSGTDPARYERLGLSQEFIPSVRTTARAIKGGSFRSDRLGCMVGAQMTVDPRLCSDDGGFRVCREDES